MNIEEALAVEIQTLKNTILESYRNAEARGGMYIGSVYRSRLQTIIDSYERILRNLKK